MKGIFWALQRRLNCYWELKIDFFSDFFYFNLYPITFCDTHTVNLLPSHLGVSTRFLWWSCGKRNVFSESEVTWQVIGDSEWLHHGVFGVECYQTQTDKKTKSAKFDEDIVRLGLCHSDKTAKSFYLRSDKTCVAAQSADIIALCTIRKAATASTNEQLHYQSEKEKVSTWTSPKVPAIESMVEDVETPESPNCSSLKAPTIESRVEDVETPESAICCSLKGLSTESIIEVVEMLESPESSSPQNPPSDDNLTTPSTSKTSRATSEVSKDSPSRAKEKN